MDISQTILISDMDDTLFDSQKCISNKNLTAIREFQDKGGIFTIATGRSAIGFRPYQEKIESKMPVILCNGSCIYDYKNEQMIWMKMLPKEIKLYIEKLMREFPMIGVQITTESGIYSYRPTPAYREFLKRENITYIEVKNFEEISPNWLKLELTSDLVNKEGLDLFLKETMIEGCRWMITGEYSYEIVAEEVSKGSAVLLYKELFGLNEKILCCIGDHNNDYEMIRMADIGFAVGNALNRIKKEADIVVMDNNHDAIADAIRLIEML